MSSNLDRRSFVGSAAATSAFTIERPSPGPRWRVPALLDSKRSKTFSSASGAMPRPRSETLNTISPGRRIAASVKEPIDVRQALMRLRTPILIGQDAGEARCRTQFERSRRLRAGDGDRLLVVGDRRGICSATDEEIAEQAMDFRFSPSLAAFAHGPKRFLERAMSEIRLIVSGIGVGEECQANRAKYP